MVYLKNVFESQIQSLCPEGFEKDKNLSLFKRVEKTNIKRIHISVNEYFPHSAQVVGVSVDIKFDATENILNPLLLKYNLTEGISTIGKVMNDVKDVNYSVLDTEIYNDVTFNIVAVEIKKILDIGVLPFFEKYNSLYNVASLLSDKKPEEIVPYIQGAILLPKTVLILKQVNHPNYKNKLVEFYQVLLQYAEKKESYRVFFKIFNELFGGDLK